MSVRVAVIGAGIMGADHARIIAEDIGGATLHVVCDASHDRAKQIAENYGAYDVSTDPYTTIAREDVDAVLIASPDETHASLCLSAIAAGKPVLCEKPLSQSVAECVSVVEAEVAKGVQLVQMGFMRRFDPSYRAMRDAVVEGRFGRPLMMHNCHRNVEAPANFTGRMSITNAAPHEFDIIRFVLGTDYKAISVFQPAGLDSGQGASAVLMVLETDRGQVVTVEVNNNASYGYDIRGEVVGETGTVSLNTPSYARYNGALTSSVSYPADWRPRFSDAYRLQDRAFVDFVRTGMFPTSASTAWDGYYATAIAQSALKALVEKSRIEIATSEKPGFYH